jgi:hypothetical protein
LSSYFTLSSFSDIRCTRGLAASPRFNAPEDLTQKREGLGIETVTTVGAVDGALDDSRVLEDFEMLGHARLCELEFIGEVTHDAFTVGKDLHHPEPDWVRKSSQQQNRAGFIEGLLWRLHIGIIRYRCELVNEALLKDMGGLISLSSSGRAGASARDPSCGARIDATSALAFEEYAGSIYHFCSDAPQARRVS